MQLLAATPALPVFDMAKAVAFYRDQLGFNPRHVEDGFAILQRDAIEIHLWAANDPHCRGAEPHLAGTASCRVQVSGLQALFEEYRGSGALNAKDAIELQPWGDHDFTVFDVDRNVIAFFEASI